jgi:hypothetical protein
MKPLSCNPDRINGISGRLIISHHENNYDGAVQARCWSLHCLQLLPCCACARRDGLQLIKTTTSGHSRKTCHTEYERYMKNCKQKMNTAPQGCSIGAVLSDAVLIFCVLSFADDPGAAEDLKKLSGPQIQRMMRLAVNLRRVRRRASV